MNITENKPNADQFLDLFLTTGWNDNYKLTKEELFEALEKSWYSVSCFSEDKLIGFGRIICDGIVHALILDVIILLEYQGKGIGKKIMDKLLEKCKKHNIRDIQLFSAKDKAGFYEKLGFKSRPENGPRIELK